MAGKATKPDTQRVKAKTAASKAAFLSALEETVTVIKAARVAGINRATVYAWLDADPEFAEAFREVDDGNVERLEAEAFRRAHDGVVKREKRNEEGEIEYQEIEYSDTLLALLLKARRPNVYRDRATVEHTGAGGGAVKVEATHDLSKLSKDELRAFLALSEKASAPS